MKKEIELAYERLPKLLTMYGFKRAYVRSENEYIAIVLCEQKKPLSLSSWLDFETFVKLDISRNIILLGQEHRGAGRCRQEPEHQGRRQLLQGGV